MSIRGCIEFATASGVLAGWVRDDRPDVGIELEVHWDGVLLVYARPTADRADIGPRSAYHIDLGRPIRMIDLLCGRLSLRARSSVSDDVEILRPTDRVADLAIEDFVATDIAALRTQDRERLFAEIGAGLPVADDSAMAARASQQRHRHEIAGMIDTLPAFGADADTSSMLGLPVGHISPDGTAMIGRDGTLFLVGGGNALLGQYLQREDEGLAEAAARWAALFEQRLRALRERGTDYLQIVIPEKLGVFRSRFPRTIPTESPLLRRLERAVAANPPVARSYLSVADLFRAEPSLRGNAFPRTDSHLSFEGNFAVFAAILRRMGLVPPDPPRALRPSPITGDLAERFFGVTLFDRIMLPEPELEARLSEGLELVEAFNPDGRHVGIRYVWRNDRAPYPQKVVAFANSFFERGGDARCLSWWFARSFREFHFVWHPNVDLDYVDREQPDWVLAQTIERFLPVHPQS